MCGRLDESGIVEFFHNYTKLAILILTDFPTAMCTAEICEYRLGTVNSKSFVGKVLLRIKWKFELN